MVEETPPRIEEILEGTPSKFPEPSRVKDTSCCDKQTVVVLHRETFNKSRAELSWCEANLKRLTEERDTLKCLYVQKGEDLRDLRAELAKARKEEAELDEQITNLLKEYGLYPPVEANTFISQLQQKLERIELLRGEVDQVKADYDRWKENMDRLAAEKEAALAKLASVEVELRGAKEKGSAQAKRIEELEAMLAEAKAEVGETKIAADKSIAVYLADAEADQTQLREASARERRSNDLAKCQSRRETLKEIHARGFDLSEEIAKAKALEADARFLVSSSSSDVDDESSQGRFDNDEGLEEEAAPKGETSPVHN
ncbi:PREDICTED: intraflagellar transport protein 81 homolog [Nicotiana attenuata]|uniref:intraflagellar transport protein 81 homolog n=1 Tax=Nicotiana attenuata TaxID=49451 RepID=UPI000904CD18|nr:PREDICTED: intraflagellar transport protein 81 homolog [Nicotiana attenuata]